MWQDILKTVAPILGTAILGPFGGMAAKAITGALLGEDNATDDIEAAKVAIANATPADLLALKTADQNFKVEMKKLDVDIMAIDVDNTKDARAMNKEMKSNAPAAIAACVLLGFFGILTAIIFVPLPDTAIQPLNIMLGVLGTLVVSIGNFYFGSSHGSKMKTALMGKK